MITKFNIQDWVQIWILKKRITASQGQAIFQAVISGFDIEVVLDLIT